MTKIFSHPWSKLGLGLALALSFPVASQAQTALQKCSSQYRAAKVADQLNGLSWNQFRSQCPTIELAQANPLKPPAQAHATQAPVAQSPAVQAPAVQAPTTRATNARGNAAKTPATPVDPIPPALGGAPAGNAVFPKAINPKYANETPAKQRSKTCLDQYNANKTSNGNGGLKWIEKGGGYYSQCSARLKG
jgi:hypothetical protein